MEGLGGTGGLLGTEAEGCCFNLCSNCDEIAGGYWVLERRRSNVGADGAVSIIIGLGSRITSS